eukprot:6971101-Lingulodinium_polyedra.AAC.1
MRRERPVKRLLPDLRPQIGVVPLGRARAVTQADNAIADILVVSKQQRGACHGPRRRYRREELALSGGLLALRRPCP